ncbi:unnamed protein product [Amoebophrya sp. A25]|nr:unnamed protein product [Amoebophrya sp. A25]|eukprot:GSA25T00023235001.1
MVRSSFFGPAGWPMVSIMRTVVPYWVVLLRVGNGLKVHLVTKVELQEGTAEGEHHGIKLQVEEQQQEDTTRRQQQELDEAINREQPQAQQVPQNIPGTVVPNTNAVAPAAQAQPQPPVVVGPQSQPRGLVAVQPPGNSDANGNNNAQLHGQIVRQSPPIQNVPAVGFPSQPQTGGTAPNQVQTSGIVPNGQLVQQVPANAANQIGGVPALQLQVPAPGQVVSSPVVPAPQGIPTAGTTVPTAGSGQVTGTGAGIENGNLAGQGGGRMQGRSYPGRKRKQVPNDPGLGPMPPGGWGWHTETSSDIIAEDEELLVPRLSRARPQNRPNFVPPLAARFFNQQERSNKTPVSSAPGSPSAAASPERFEQQPAAGLVVTKRAPDGQRVREVVAPANMDSLEMIRTTAKNQGRQARSLGTARSSLAKQDEDTHLKKRETADANDGETADAAKKDEADAAKNDESSSASSSSCCGGSTEDENAKTSDAESTTSKASTSRDHSSTSAASSSFIASGTEGTAIASTAASSPSGLKEDSASATSSAASSTPQLLREDSSVAPTSTTSRAGGPLTNSPASNAFKSSFLHLEEGLSTPSSSATTPGDGSDHIVRSDEKGVILKLKDGGYLVTTDVKKVGSGMYVPPASVSTMQGSPTFTETGEIKWPSGVQPSGLVSATEQQLSEGRTLVGKTSDGDGAQGNEGTQTEDENPGCSQVYIIVMSIVVILAIIASIALYLHYSAKEASKATPTGTSALDQPDLERGGGDRSPADHGGSSSEDLTL